MGGWVVQLQGSHVESNNHSQTCVFITAKDLIAAPRLGNLGLSPVADGCINLKRAARPTETRWETFSPLGIRPSLEVGSEVGFHRTSAKTLCLQELRSQAISRRLLDRLFGRKHPTCTHIPHETSCTTGHTLHLPVLFCGREATVQRLDGLAKRDERRQGRGCGWCQQRAACKCGNVFLVLLVCSASSKAPLAARRWLSACWGCEAAESGWPGLGACNERARAC